MLGTSAPARPMQVFVLQSPRGRRRNQYRCNMSLRADDSLPPFYRSLTASQKVFVRTYVESSGDEFLATKKSGVQASALAERIIRRAVFELASRHISACQK